MTFYSQPEFKFQNKNTKLNIAHKKAQLKIVVSWQNC